jgi:hypothetical protein
MNFYFHLESQGPSQHSLFSLIRGASSPPFTTLLLLFEHPCLTQKGHVDSQAMSQLSFSDLYSYFFLTHVGKLKGGQLIPSIPWQNGYANSDQSKVGVSYKN